MLFVINRQHLNFQKFILKIKVEFDKNDTMILDEYGRPNDLGLIISGFIQIFSVKGLKVEIPCSIIDKFIVNAEINSVENFYIIEKFEKFVIDTISKPISIINSILKWSRSGESIEIRYHINNNYEDAYDL